MTTIIPAFSRVEGDLLKIAPPYITKTTTWRIKTTRMRKKLNNRRKTMMTTKKIRPPSLKKPKTKSSWKLTYSTCLTSSSNSTARRMSGNTSYAKMTRKKISRLAIWSQTSGITISASMQILPFLSLRISMRGGSIGSRGRGIWTWGRRGKISWRWWIVRGCRHTSRDLC